MADEISSKDFTNEEKEEILSLVKYYCFHNPKKVHEYNFNHVCDDIEIKLMKGEDLNCNEQQAIKELTNYKLLNSKPLEYEKNLYKSISKKLSQVAIENGISWPFFKKRN